MATTSLFLDMRGKAKDGKGSVLIVIYHNHSTTSVATGVRVARENWLNQKVVKHPDAEALNARLQKQKMKIDHSIAILTLEDEFASLSAAEVKKAIASDMPKIDRGHSIASLFEEYLSGGNLKEGTKDLYHHTLKKVLQFGGENLKIENMNLKWLRSFDAELAKTQSANGRSIYMRCLRAVFNYARNNEIKCPYPFSYFKIKQEETKKRNIVIEDMRKLYSFPTSITNAYYRDYFFLIFFLIGINVKDLLLAKKSQVINGRLEYIREKTGKKYSIKIEPEAQEIISRHSGRGDYLLEAMDHCQHYKSFARQINAALKNIGEKSKELVRVDNGIFEEEIEQEVIHPIVPNIGTYYARHSWATIAYDIGISMDVVSQALGHSAANRTTLVYVKFDQEKVDLANRQVLNYFFDTGGTE